MIRIKPYEWLHLKVPGSGRLGRTKVSGMLYITPHRVVIQGGNGPAWSSPIHALDVKSRGGTGRLETEDGHQIEWKSKMHPAWWCNAILFWKDGVVAGRTDVDGPPPIFRNIAELPEAISRSKWNIRWYDRDTLAKYGIPGTIPATDEFDRVCRHTNIILAALRHDGFPNGPPPTYYRLMLKRHALTQITHLAWGWREARRHVRDVVCGRDRLARAYAEYHADMGWPDRMYEPKPFAGTESKWHHEINPASSGGTTYQILERCRKMIPVVTRVADELHENPTQNPYLRMRQLFEAIRDGKKIPPPPREALELARDATDNPW